MIRILRILAVLSLSSAAMAQDKPLITVVGEGVVSTAPTESSMILGVETSEKEPDLTKVKNDSIYNKLIVLIREIGIPSADIQITSSTLEPRYNYREDGQTLIGYAMRRTVQVRVRDLAKVDQLLSRATRAGVNSIFQSQYGAPNEAELRLKALERAVAHAHSKAEALAKAGGISLGRVYSMNEEAQGMVRPVYRNQMNARTESTEVAPAEYGNIEVKSTVVVQYEVTR